MRTSFDGLYLRNSSPTSTRDSDPIVQLPDEKWTVKEVKNGRPTKTHASPLERLEGAAVTLCV